ncbi:LuxR family transcriptional regulator [Shinella sumterensis]|uniref:Autoinducer binding domain-containing protein n=1 Tax=Shinella sumterensis TaxID=1967501 RepID=A0AA50CRC4_9HYPH|nr:autoinducer binding domain-containing protein [Shinella sumterensis]WLS00658.1 autoinducer binding domain-containing protein [Shinella sumterensis]
MNSERPSRFERIAHEVQETENVQKALYIFQRAYGVEFATYHLALTIVDIVDTPYVRTTYNDAWVSRYLLRDYVKIDPVLREGLVRQLPFDWREVDIPQAAHEFLLDAQDYGVGANGYSIPIIDKSRRALLSLNSRQAGDVWSATVAQYRDEWLELAFLIHHKAIFELYGEHDPVPQLSPREIECLHWTALGKDSIDIAAILKLSEHTTRAYIKSARHKLGGGSITYSIARAMQLRLIHPFGNTPS